MDKKELLNKIKWQLYMRSPNGGIRKKINEQELFALKKNYLKMAYTGQYLGISPLEMFVKGYYSVKPEDVYKFYEYLLASNKVRFKYHKEGFYLLDFEIGNDIISIPYPPLNNINELASLRFELLDLLLPYMISNLENFKNLSFNEGPYEYNGKSINVILNEGDNVLDLGANFGLFSAYAASRGCNVYAFEPMQRAVDYYLKKIQIIYDNIKVIDKAISNEIGESKLCIDNKNFGGSFLSQSSNGETVKTITVDSFVNENLNHVDFIKADIEGYECEMLEGAKETLKYFHPKLAICKYHKLNDEKNIKKLILSANPNYVIESKWKKIYAEYKK